MGAQRVRRLLLAAAAGALLASGAAASVYSYETKWLGHLGMGGKSFWLSFVGGDGSAIGASYDFVTGNEGAGMGYAAFDSNGRHVHAGMFWEKYHIILGSERIYGFVLLNGGAVAAYAVNYYDPAEERYYVESYLKYKGNPGWEIKMDGYGLFRALARNPNGQYIYCYRYYLGDFLVCKMTAMGTVVSYFNPAAEPDDLAVDAAGYIYALSGDIVRKYDGNGSLMGSWNAPVALTDVSADAQNRVLAFSSSNKYTYVFSDAGALLGSFTAPYGYSIQNIRYGDAGPDGKYYVGCLYEILEDYWGVEMYRFAPSPTNIVPTSLGKIKAIFN